MRKKVKKIISAVITISFMITQLTVGFTLSKAYATGEISIPDRNLEQVIRDRLSKPSGDLTLSDMARLTELSAEWKEIRDLNGLQYANNLTVLNLSGNQINNISPLTNLPNLQYLYLQGNQINDISYLNNKTQLIVLDLRDNNNISNINHLSSLTNLKMLYLSGNNINDVTPLTSLTKLEILDLKKNQITNINNLDRLTQLTWLDIGNNQIKDISVLRYFTKIHNLYLGNNLIGSLTSLNYLPELKEINLGINPLGDSQTDPANEPAEIIQTLENRNVKVICNLILTSPIENYITNMDKVVLRGRGAIGSTVKVNNNSVQLDSKGNFNLEYTLQDGRNTFNIVATDNQGNNIGSLTRTVVYDKYSLTMTVYAPANKLAVSNDWVNVEGKADVGSTITILVNGNSTGQPAVTDSQGYFSKKVSLTPGENTLRITANKAGNNYTTVIRKVTYDNLPPILNITGPNDNFLTNQRTINVTGSTELGSIVRINNTIVNIDVNGSFSKVVNLTTGNNNIVITSTDLAGNIRTVTKKVICDDIPPSLVITDPYTYREIQTYKSTIKISGYVDEGSIVKINNENVEIDVLGNFTKVVELSNGYNTIVISATDRAGNTAILTKKVESFGPSITFPPNKYRTNNNSLVITGKATVGTVLRINNELVNVDVDGDYSKVVNLNLGINTITLSGTINGTTETLTRKVVYDNIAELTIKTPVDNLQTNKSTVTITGNAEKGSIVNIKNNNIEKGNATIDVLGNFSKSIDLTPGTNILTITATDLAGNNSVITRKVIYDNIAPEINITNPEENYHTNKNIVLRGTTEIGSVVKVNGTTVPVDSSGRFNNEINLVNGLNNININATDIAGNTKTITRHVYFDNIKPMLSVFEPIEDETRNSKITVKGIAELGSNVKINDAEVNIDNEGKFSKEIDLSIGNNTIIISATDQVDNTTTIKKNVIYDITPPIIDLITTPTFSTNLSATGNFKVSWSGKDIGVSTGVSSYDVQYKIGSSGNWQDWKIGTIINYGFIKGIPGNTYYFRARARDKAGNLGDWSTKLYFTIVPFDNSSLVLKKVGFIGTSNKPKSSNYLGTLIYSKKAKDEITYKFTGYKVALIGYKSPLYSKAKIYIDGRYVATVDEYSKTTKPRQVLLIATWKEVGTHTIKIVNLATKGREKFAIDGLAVGR